jgi:hypothetical protein
MFLANIIFKYILCWGLFVYVQLIHFIFLFRGRKTELINGQGLFAFVYLTYLRSTFSNSRSCFVYRLEEPARTPEPQATAPTVPNVGNPVTPRVIFTGLNPGAVRRLTEVSSF